MSGSFLDGFEARDISTTGITGDAPDGLVFERCLRAGAPPRVRYRAGVIRLPRVAASAPAPPRGSRAAGDGSLRTDAKRPDRNTPGREEHGGYSFA